MLGPWCDFQITDLVGENIMANPLVLNFSRKIFNRLASTYNGELYLRTNPSPRLARHIIEKTIEGSDEDLGPYPLENIPEFEEYWSNPNPSILKYLMDNFDKYMNPANKTRAHIVFSRIKPEALGPNPDAYLDKLASYSCHMCEKSTCVYIGDLIMQVGSLDLINKYKSYAEKITDKYDRKIMIQDINRNPTLDIKTQFEKIKQIIPYFKVLNKSPNTLLLDSINKKEQIEITDIIQLKGVISGSSLPKLSYMHNHKYITGLIANSGIKLTEEYLSSPYIFVVNKLKTWKLIKYITGSIL